MFPTQVQMAAMFSAIFAILVEYSKFHQNLSNVSRVISSQTDRQTDRQIDRQTDKQTDRCTDKQIDRHL